MPQSYRDATSGYRLGTWVSNQRTDQGTMLPERHQRLDALGFVWDPRAAQWEEGFRFFARYRNAKGDCLVLVTYREPTSGYRLGGWVSEQRMAQDTMSPERHQRLDTLGFVWDPYAAQWEEGFRFLEIFCQREGHCRVPDKHREQGYRLGGWVSEQRMAQDTMSPERRQRLDTLGFVWDVLTTQWEEGFRFLARYRNAKGDCLIPRNYREPTAGYRLEQWVGEQRSTRDTMSPERRQRLDALGFVWDPHVASWEEGFRFLARYRQREGHCRVPTSHRELGFRLGGWVDKQRQTQETLLPERRQQLDALGFIWKVR